MGAGEAVQVGQVAEWDAPGGPRAPWEHGHPRAHVQAHPQPSSAPAPAYLAARTRRPLGRVRRWRPPALALTGRARGGAVPRDSNSQSGP